MIELYEIICLFPTTGLLYYLLFIMFEIQIFKRNKNQNRRALLFEVEVVVEDDAFDMSS